jgi:DNA polymerase-1
MYKRIIVYHYSQHKELIEHLKRSHGWLAFDTETTGLHLKADKPFLITITFDNTSYALPVLEGLQEVFDAMSHFDLVFGHNIKFDLHMLENIGVTYKHDNLADTMILARLSLETDQMFTIALKALAKKFLSVDADEDEKAVKSALTALRRHNTNLLKQVIKDNGMTKKAFDEMAKDTVYEPLDFHKKFMEEHPEPTYEDVYRDPVYRDQMLSYAMNDTEITIDLAKLMYPVVIAKDQKSTFERECKLIKPLFRMERVGLYVDRPYIERSRRKTRQYILQKREQLAELAGETVKIGQHKRIKDLFRERWGVSLQSSDDRSLAGVDGGVAYDAAKIIRELRTLEKWYSAYILRLLDKSAYDGRAYTQINQSSAVTGRVSSDFQQFPKYGMTTDTGEELFHPRRAIIVTGGGYDSTYYLDYSQIELRVQANYTYDISGGDTNMCRAYMPFDCVDNKGKDFNPKEDRDLIFTQTWYQKENNEVWHPVDLHNATAMQAFPEVDPKSEEFKKLRFLGKSTNFAKNYGATAATLMAQFGFEEEVAKKMDNAYYRAFPKILDYQKLVRDTYSRRGFVKNRYGRRYYLENRRFVYRLYNYIIQGTCADMLKEKIIEVDDLLTPYKSRFQMNIHDELSFEIYNGEEFLIPAIKKIMEDIDWMTVPVVADVEVTHTNWAEKEDVK